MIIHSVREADQPRTVSPLGQLAARATVLLEARWFGYAFGVAAVLLMTALLVVLARTRVANTSTLFALTVLVTEAAVVAFVAFDFIFVEPTYQFVLTEPQEYVTLLVFLVTALVAVQLAATLRQQAQQREREALALYEVARLVPGSTLELQPLLGVILDQLQTIVGYDAAAVGGTLEIASAPGAGTRLRARVPLDRSQVRAGAR